MKKTIKESKYDSKNFELLRNKTQKSGITDAAWYKFSGSKSPKEVYKKEGRPQSVVREALALYIGRKLYPNHVPQGRMVFTKESRLIQHHKGLEIIKSRIQLPPELSVYAQKIENFIPVDYSTLELQVEDAFIKDNVQGIEKKLAFEVLIGSSDQHFGNFGFQKENLVFFDYGHSFEYDELFDLAPQMTVPRGPIMYPDNLQEFSTYVIAVSLNQHQQLWMPYVDMKKMRDEIEYLVSEKARAIYKKSFEKYYDYVYTNLKNGFNRPFYNQYSRHVEIQNVQLFQQNQVFNTYSPIHFSIELKSKAIFKNGRFSVSIHNSLDECIGVYFGENSISMSKNIDVSFSVTLKDHFLAKGIYYLNIGIGFGNELTTIEDYDFVKNVLCIKIDKLN
jgi:hypothetical protein